MNKLLKVTLVGIVILLVGLIWALRQVRTETWIATATDFHSRPFEKAFALSYLKTFGHLDSYNRSLNLPPLEFVLGGCAERLPEDRSCRETFEWLLEKGEDINAIDSTKLGFTPLHSAIVACRPGAVDYVLSKGADPNIAATGERFQGRSPLKIVDLLKNCSAASRISELLRAKGARDSL